jgi:uncharacterized protein (TIGR03437 family)
MSRRKKYVINAFLVVTAIAPIILYAYEYGPDPGFSTAPGDNATGCIASGCHTGTINSGKGSVQIVASGGTTYVPGQTQTIMVTITDSTEKKYGFQLSARIDSSPKTLGAGLLIPGSDGYTQTLCADNSNAPATGCTAANGGTIEWIEHTLNGYYASATSPSYTYKFTWTPPATNVGTITMYAAGNAVTGQLVVTGTQTYSTSLQLSPASSTTGGSTPTVSSGGVVSASSFGGFTSAAPGSWIEIYGTNLGPATPYTWQGSDFNGSSAPTTINGVKVTVGGQPCYVDYTSSTQVNAQIPANVSTGAQPLVVTTASGSSSPYSLMINTLQPGLLAPSSFAVSGKQYVVAFDASQATAAVPTGPYVLPPGAISGLSSAYAKPGDTIVIYGVGFGGVSPSSVSDAGQVVSATNTLSNPFSMSIGGSVAPLLYYGLAPGYVGLYQFNVTIPQIANNDFAPLTFSLAGTAGSQTLYTAVHN